MRIYFALIALTFTWSLYAQENSNLVETFKFFEEQKGISFSYDPELLSLIKHQINYSELDFEEFLNAFNQLKLPVEITSLDNTFYTIATKETEYIVVAHDVDGNPINPEDVSVVKNGIVLESSVSEDGVRFNYKPNREDSLLITALGFDPITISVSQLLNETIIEAGLDLMLLELPDLIVSDYLTSGISMNTTNNSIKVNTRDLPLLPGETDGDLFASLAALPGITTPDNRAGNLYIRGSSTDQSLILFDDIPIYHRGHYYGTISPYNPKLVDTVTVSRSGYHPRLGGRVGGAVQIESSSQWKEDADFGVGSNTLYGTAYTRIPFKKGGIAIGGRKSYPFDFNSPKLRSITDMVFDASNAANPAGDLPDDIVVDFQDYNAKVAIVPFDNNLISVSTIYTSTEISYSALTIGTKEQNGFQNIGFNLKWETDYGNGWRTRFSGILSDYNYEYLSGPETPDYGPDIDGVYSLNDISDIQGSAELIKDQSNGNSLQLGADIKRQEVYFENKSTTPNNDTPVFRSQDLGSNTLSPYVNYELGSLSRMYLQAGVRANYYTLLNDFRIEPRLSVSYDASDRVILKANAGLYNQYISQVKNLEFTGGGFDNELWLLANDETGGIISGAQLMGGITYHTKDWVVDAEGYYKRAEGLSHHSGRRFTDRTFWLYRDLNVTGFDIFIKRKIGQHTSVWGGYSYNMMTTAFDTASNIEYEDKYSQPHVIYLGMAYTRSQFKVSAGWRFASGLVAYSLDVIEVERGFQRMRSGPPPGGDPDRPPGMTPPPNMMPPMDQNPFANIPDRYPNIHFLDVSASYTLPENDKRSFNLTTGLSIINFYNQTNLTDRVIRIPNGNVVFIDRNAISFAPNLMVLIEF